MPQRAVTIESLPQAFDVVKEMQVDGLDWGEGYAVFIHQNKSQGISTPVSLTHNS